MRARLHVGPGFWNPRRRLAMAGVLAVATLGTWVLFPAGGVIGAFILVVTLPLAPLAAWAAIRLWRGTLPHTMMAGVPVSAQPLSVVRYQACAPCLILSFVSMVLAVDVGILTETRVAATQWLAIAGWFGFILFAGLALLVAATMSPAFLLPATMRPGRSA